MKTAQRTFTVVYTLLAAATNVLTTSLMRAIVVCQATGGVHMDILHDCNLFECMSMTVAVQ
jgi:hypothetical protein